MTPTGSIVPYTRGRIEHEPLKTVFRFFAVTVALMGLVCIVLWEPDVKQVAGSGVLGIEIE